MSIVNGTKIVTLVSAANGDTYGDAERHFMRTVQALLQANVISMALNTPPGSPANGDTYVVATGGTGAWSGHDHQIAYWAIDAQDGVVTTGVWEFYVPVTGWRLYDANTSAAYQYNGSTWILQGSKKVTVAPSGGVVTINPALGSSFRVNVTAAVTSVIINNGLYDGQDITILWVQDGTGHAIAGLAANVHNSSTAHALSITANAVSAQRYTWDSTASIWYALGDGAAGM